MGNYAVANDIRHFKVEGCPLELDNYSDADIDTEIALAEEIVETLTNNTFYNKSETNYLDGNGLTKLFFYPQIPYPLLTITSVKDLDIDGTTVLFTYVENRDFVKYPHYIETARVIDGDSPRRRFGSGGTWPKGQKNIQIVGTWGKSSVPESIKRATILLVAARLDPSGSQITSGDFTEAEWEDFRIKLGAGDIDLETGTGFPEVDRLLRMNLNHVDMFLVVPDEKQTYDSVD